MRTFKIGVALVMLTLSARSADAIKCWNPSTDVHIAQTDMIFYGEVLAHPFPSGSAPTGARRVAAIRVIEAYKDTPEPIVRVGFIDDWGQDGGWKFQPGDALMVFAKRQTGNDAIDAVSDYCQMLPYHRRQSLHPAYWRQLLGMRGQ